MSSKPYTSINHKSLHIVDPIWDNVRMEAERAVSADQVMAHFIYGNILNHESLESAIMFRICERLGHENMSADVLRHSFAEMAEKNPQWSKTVRIDLQSTFDRDPACKRYIEAILYYKGFHAIQTHRLAHWLWQQGRTDLALYLQSRSSSVFQTDIHPAAQIGEGVFLDHATGLVVGETAVIDDNVSILHGVTLGGTGKQCGDRHPKIRHGVLIGAGAKILGNIEIGHCSKIASGSVVLKDMPANVTIAGVPAKIVGESGCKEPSTMMDHLIKVTDISL